MTYSELLAELERSRAPASAIFMAEDDPVSHAVLRNHLEKWGFSVSTASDGIGTWAAVQKANSPALVILDWMMPGMDGI